MPTRTLVTILFLTAVAACPFISHDLQAASACASTQYETDNGDCFPVWHGQTRSGAYYTIVIPENWDASDGLVFWKSWLSKFFDRF